MDTADISDAAVILNGVITVKPRLYSYHPIFAREELTDGDHCEVEVVDYNDGNFTIGVATAELRNRDNQYDNKNSMCVIAKYSRLYFDGKRE